VRVKVYRNLTKKCWSVLSSKTGLVIDRPTSLILKNVRFVVRESGRQKVLEQRRKNVHSFAVGNRSDLESYHSLAGSEVQISYNPYKSGHFFVLESNRPIDGADSIYCIDGMVLAKNPVYLLDQNI
jgi:hypothetical protein